MVTVGDWCYADFDSFEAGVLGFEVVDFLVEIVDLAVECGLQTYEIGFYVFHGLENKKCSRLTEVGN